MVEAKVIGGQFFSFLYSFDYLSTEVNQKKIKRCNQPNSLTDKEKAIISDGLSRMAPKSLFISNQITKNLESLSELSDYISEGYNQNILNKSI